jgi:hypothetical protein
LTREFWKSHDMYGRKVELTFKGKDTYKTSVGAFVSLSVKVVILIFIIYEIYVINMNVMPTVS